MPLRRSSTRIAVWFAVLCCAPAALAQEPDIEEEEESALPSVAIHGFVSQGFMWTTHNNFLTKSHRGSFELSEVGVNFTSQLTDQLRVGAQLFARDLGPIGNYSAKFDWYYLDYHWRDWLGLRAGRVKLPFGLYNEFSDVDVATVPVLLPQSVYPIENRDFLLAQTGVELYGYATLGPNAGALDYRIYGGTIYLQIPAQETTPYELQVLNIPYVVGARVLYETPLAGLRLGGSLQLIRLEAELDYEEVGTAEIKLPETLLWIGSIEYQTGDLLLAAEYSRWHYDIESDNPMLFPEREVESERMYAMAAYHVTPWLQVATYYALLFPNTDDREGREAQRHDVAATLRFHIMDHWLIKLESHYMNGTAGLRPSLNDGEPTNELTRQWWVFLAKTTAYF